ncbi:MAG: hypothetical protein ACOX45_09235 [Acutalibacteraceae bacterium]
MIGVIMLGMALGNHLGGRFADRYVPSRMLALLFLSAAGACFLILPLNSLAGMLHFLGGAAWPLRIFLPRVSRFSGTRSASRHDPSCGGQNGT